MQKRTSLALLILVLMTVVSCASVAGANDDVVRQTVREQVRAEFPSIPISIQVMNGRVTLNGVVDNAAQRDRIVELVRSVEGVSSVSNNLGVRS